jgi:protein-S-isoprenylcysteine O-methyltransferase Ste14
MSIRLLSSVPAASRSPILIGLVGLVGWALAERWMYAIKLQQGKGSSRDRGSFLLLHLSWYGSVILSLLDAVQLRWSTVDPAHSAVQFAGVPFVVLGLIARVVARLTLGRAFSPVVQTTDGHNLVTEGIYGMIRHPAYLGTLCLLIGFPLCFGSLAGLGIACAVGVPVLIYRIQVEERALRAWFGEEYEEYSRKTKRLIPYLW